MIFGFKKKGPQASFKARVEEFWRWFPTVADRFYQTIEKGDCPSLAPEVSAFMDRWMPNLSWVFGPGAGSGHSFTITGEGQVPKQLLAEYWQSQAPEIPGWTFYGSKQPSSPEMLKDVAIQLGENEQVDAEHFLINHQVDAEAQKLHIVAWHPSLQLVPEDHHYQLLFLLLDEALGEFGTETWLGEIKIEPIVAAANTITLVQLPDTIRKVNDYYQWEKLPPLRAYSVYEISEQRNSPRGDTFVGSTCIMSVIEDFLSHGRLTENPLEGTGAEFVYLAIDASVFPAGKQADVRGNIEDALDDALMNAASGRILGGAFGTNQAYIDLLLLDGETSRKIVEQVLDQLQLTSRTKLKQFA